MSSILAFSVSGKIDQYGAYAGFASVLGLAILSLLYFAQAREVKRLREWAGRAPERAADVQDRAVAAAQQRVIAQPQRNPTPPTPPAPAVRRAPGPATPAGQAGAAAPAAAAATAAGAATATAPGQQTSVQPAANGAAATPPTARPGEPLRVPPAAAAATPPPGSTRTNYGPDDRDDDEGRSRLAVGGAIAAVVVVLIIIVVLVTGVLGGRSDDSGTQPSSTLAGTTTTRGGGTRTRTRTTPSPTTVTPKPGTYEVAVLNGTTVPGLARGVATRLQNTRFKIGTVTNAATQDRSATLVEFLPGHRAEGDAVAKAIDVGSDAIQQMSAGSKTIAGSSATVVVTVGSDQNQTPAAPTGTTTTQ